MVQFPIQFGREVRLLFFFILAQKKPLFQVLSSKALLDCDDKVDWRNCALSKEVETELTNKLKEGFKQFDFTNEDSDED